MARNLKAQIDIVADTKGVTAGVNKTERAFTGLGKSLGLTAISITGALAAVGAGIQKLREGFRLAGQERALELQLQRTGNELDTFVKKLDTAARGTITRAELINQASNAIALGIPAERLSEILAIARTGAVATGQTVEFAFQSLTTGLARSSRLLLDNVGIIIDVEKANNAYAASLGKTAEQLTEVEKKQAFVNEALDQGVNKFGDLDQAIGRGSVAFDRLSAGLTDLGDEVAKTASESGFLADILNLLLIPIDSIKSLFEDDLTPATKKLGSAQEDLARELAKTTSAADDQRIADEELEAEKASLVKQMEDEISRLEFLESRKEADTEVTEQNTVAIIANNEARVSATRATFGYISAVERLNALLQQQGVISANTFDKIRKLSGEQAAIAAAIASGATISGRRVDLHGGSRLITKDRGGVVPVGQSTLVPGSANNPSFRQLGGR